MNVAQLARIPATESLTPAISDYLAGNYQASIDVCLETIAAEGPLRQEALLLAARGYNRSQRPREAIKLLTGELPAFASAALKFEAEGLLSVAHGALHDFATASLYTESITGPETEGLPVALRSELFHFAALVAWMNNELRDAETALARSAIDTSIQARGRNAITESWIAAKRGAYDEQARLLLRGVEILKSASPLDVGIVAGACRALCALARDISIPGLAAAAQQIYSEIPWTPDLAIDQFVSARTLGWALSLQGPTRYFEALRLMHKASSIAPSAPWRVFALLDRATLKRHAGEAASSAADLYEALDLAKSIDWSTTLDESRAALIGLAELMAQVDVREAASLLALSSEVKESTSARMLMLTDPRTEAYRSYAAGVVQEALNEPRKAKRFFETAFSIWNEAGYFWAAARAALRLFVVSGEQTWFDTARAKIRDYPDSWVAAEINAASTGIGDDGWNRMTPRQREVFHALCEGLTARKIAERLECSPNTIRNHIHWVYQAFRVNSQPELITEARKRRLL